MRKSVFIGIFIIAIIVITILTLLRSSSGFRSIYFVPSDAIAIIETKNPLQTWDKIVHSKVWNHFKTNEYFKDLNYGIQSYDSMINSNALLFKLMGAKPIIISIHQLSSKKIENIYIADVGKVANTKNPEKLFKSILGDKYEVTSRKYGDSKIIEVLDIELGEYYFLTLSQGNLVLSFESKLLEKSIDASVEKQIGLDTRFLKVQSKISHKGLFSIYIKYKNLLKLNNSFTDEFSKTILEYTKYMSYSGLYFNIDTKGLISVEGYTTFNDDIPENYFDILSDGKTDVLSSSVIPNRLASLTKINFNDSELYFQQLMKNMGDEVLLDYKNNVAAIEKKLKINLAENIFSWMDKEIVILQTQPSNLGRNNELAIVLQANDSVLAANNLAVLWKQIKRNTPVKIKTARHKGYKIDYVAFPGIIQAFFGKTIKKLEKPYFTQIGKSVIISNHPQTIKNIINDYLEKSTLNTSMDYYNFSKLLGNKSSLLLYFEPPVLFQNIKAFVDIQTWNKLKKQEKYFTCFKQGAFNINKNDDLLHFDFKIQYSEEEVIWKQQYYNPTEIFNMFSAEEEHIEEVEKDTLPKIIISDLSSKKHEEYYENGSLKLEVKLKNGLKNGTIKMYHTNGELSLKGEYKNDEPVGKWKYYNEDGDIEKTDYYDQ